MNGGEGRKGEACTAGGRVTETAETEIARKRDWGTMVGERERERERVCAREREIESSCNSISLALPLGRHSPLPEGPTYPVPPPRSTPPRSPR